jgi:hypothetical protein
LYSVDEERVGRVKMTGKFGDLVGSIDEGERIGRDIE